MNGSPEFTAMLAKVPTHVMLTPGVHRWQDGDETYWTARNEGNEKGWYGIVKHSFGLVGTDRDIVRRPMPEHIRRSAAWWGLYNSLATVAPFGYGYRLILVKSNKRTVTVEFAFTSSHARGFTEFDNGAMGLIKILGGDETIIHHLSEGPLLDTWMASQ